MTPAHDAMRSSLWRPGLVRTVAGSVSLLLLLLACSSGEQESPGSGSPEPPAGTTSAPSTEPTEPTEPTEDTSATDSTGAAGADTPERVDPITRKVRAMSLREKVRQLLVLSFSGTSAPGDLIRRFEPGGLIYFSENLTGRSQIAALSRDSQQVSRRVGEPLLVMTDQEGGIVTRLPGTSGTPAGTDFDGDARWARRTARSTGEMLDSVGINVDLAPVADVNTVADAGVIGSRSFGSDPRVVSRLTAAQVCGYHRGGVAATAKHFPGHGSTTTDSHLEVVRIERSKKAWQRIDLPPFEAAQRAHVDLMLVGHLSVPSLDPSGRPATLSRPILGGWLRQRVGFDGVVITDSLVMKGITAYGSSREIAVRAVRAGVDQLLMPQSPAGAARGIVDAVRRGRLTEHRVDLSVTRILTLKRELGLYRAHKDLPGC